MILENLFIYFSKIFVAIIISIRLLINYNQELYEYTEKENNGKNITKECKLHNT